MKRRVLLATAGAAGVAGCFGSLRSDESSPGESGPDDGQPSGDAASDWRYGAALRGLAISDGVAYGNVVPWSSDDTDGGILALDADTGEHRWTYGPPEDVEVYSDPTVEEDIYVTIDREGYKVALAIGTDGRLRWSESGYEWSQIVDGVGYVVYVDEGHVKAHGAVDAADGEKLWTSDQMGSSPKFDSAASGSHDTFYTDGREILALSTTDGSVRWRYDGDTTGLSIAAIVDGIVYCTLDDDEHERTVAAISEGEARWKAGEGGADLRALSATREHAIVADDSNAYALDAATGETRWLVQRGTYLVDEPWIDGRSLIVDDGRAFVAGDRVYAFDLADGGEQQEATPIWTHEVDHFVTRFRALFGGVGTPFDRTLIVQIGERTLHGLATDSDAAWEWSVDRDADDDESIRDVAVGEMVCVTTNAATYGFDPT